VAHPPAVIRVKRASLIPNQLTQEKGAMLQGWLGEITPGFFLSTSSLEPQEGPRGDWRASQEPWREEKAIPRARESWLLQQFIGYPVSACWIKGFMVILQVIYK